MNDFTLSNSEYKKLHQAEESLHRILNGEEQSKAGMKSPKNQAVNNILAYSKALSIRQSIELGFIENLLN